MIEVRYRGRMGNQLFEYCLGRILAEQMGWRLHAASITGFPRTFDIVSGAAFDGPMAVLGDELVDPAYVICDRSRRRIVLEGWFQHYDYYRRYATRIQSWLTPESSMPDAFPIAKPEDMVLHLRLGADYERKKWVLDPEFYTQAMEQVRGLGRLYVCYDVREHVSPWIKDKVFSALERWRPIVVVCNNMIDDFNFVRQFRRIAIAPSTFCWWAAYLSQAEEIYFPDLRASGTSVWRSGSARLEVDEPRYVLLKARTLWD